jgi:hypothetical protein
MLYGRIPTAALHEALGSAGELGGLIIAQDLMVEAEELSLAPDDTLAGAMQSLERFGRELPVVDRGRLVGVLRAQDVVARYNSETLKRDIVQSVASTITASKETAGTSGTRLAELEVPQHFVGKSLRDLDIRRRYGVSVLMIRHANGSVTAASDADSVFVEGDVMIALGRGADVALLSEADEANRRTE